MAYERIIRRYSAYYMGWCQAFGEHDITFAEDEEMKWLFGDRQIGIALPPRLRKQALKEIIGQETMTPLMTLSNDCVAINDFKYPIILSSDKTGLEKIRNLFEINSDVHMYLTSHFCYPPGTRILTFSQKKPLIIMYKEIEPLTVRML